MGRGHYHKGRYNTMQVEVNGKMLHKSLLRGWTPIAKECYLRGCNCDGCEIVPKESFHEQCKIKDYVRGYFLLGIIPNFRGNNNDNNDN